MINGLTGAVNRATLALTSVASSAREREASFPGQATPSSLGKHDRFRYIRTELHFDAWIIGPDTLAGYSQRALERSLIVIGSRGARFRFAVPHGHCCARSKNSCSNPLFNPRVERPIEEPHLRIVRLPVSGEPVAQAYRIRAVFVYFE